MNKLKETIAKMLCEHDNVNYDMIKDHATDFSGDKTKAYYRRRAESIITLVEQSHISKSEVMRVIDDKAFFIPILGKERIYLDKDELKTAISKL